MIGPEQDAMGTNQSAGSKKKGKKGRGKKKEKKGEGTGEEAKGEGREEYDWKYVQVIAELKCVRGLMDLNPKVVLQLAGYARRAFHRQPDRQFVHGFTVVSSTLRCWVYTRSGAFASSSVDLNTAQGLSVFCRVYNGYLGMTLSEMGFAVDPAATTTPVTHDTSDTTAAPDTITIGDREIIRGEPFFTTHAIVTRGTTCWTARPTGSKTAELPWVLKFYWRYPGREHEGIMLQSCHKHKVKGVAEYIAHGHGLSVHEILGDLYIQSAVPLDLRWKINKGPSPHSRGNTYSQSHTPSATARMAPTIGGNLWDHDPPSGVAGPAQKKRKLSNTNVYIPQRLPSLGSGTEEQQMTGLYEPLNNEEVGSAAAVGTAEIPVLDRISTWVLVGRGKPIDEFTDPVELLLAMRDAVRGHWSLLIDGRFLHRH